jgi:hypothetical protein
VTGSVKFLYLFNGFCLFPEAPPPVQWVSRLVQFLSNQLSGFQGWFSSFQTGLMGFKADSSLYQSGSIRFKPPQSSSAQVLSGSSQSSPLSTLFTSGFKAGSTWFSSLYSPVPFGLSLFQSNSVNQASPTHYRTGLASLA